MLPHIFKSYQRMEDCERFYSRIVESFSMARSQGTFGRDKFVNYENTMQEGTVSYSRGTLIRVKI